MSKLKSATSLYLSSPCTYGRIVLKAFLRLVLRHLNLDKLEKYTLARKHIKKRIFNQTVKYILLLLFIYCIYLKERAQWLCFRLNTGHVLNCTFEHSQRSIQNEL